MRLEGHLRKLFALLQINCVIDVGANRGQYGASLRRMGYTGRIVSFEPVAGDFQELQKTAAKNSNWQVHRLALGDQEGVLEIYVKSDSLFNSFLRPNEFMEGQGLRIVQTEGVEVKRLDAIIDGCLDGIEDPHIFLKMDTQGYDLKVLARAGTAIKNILALQSELSVKPVYDEMPGYLEAIPVMNEAGFELTALYPIARDNALRVMEFDGVLVSTGAVGDTVSLHPP